MNLYPFHMRRSLALMSTGAHADICVVPAAAATGHAATLEEF
jgi:hypothetical protein